MKVAILLAVYILCGESKLESGFTGASHPAPESPIAVRHERQVRSCTDGELLMRANLATCDPNIGQRLVDIYVDCGGNYLTSARRFIGSCGRNENGRFCFELNNQLANYRTPLLSDCPSRNTYSDYNCTDMCRAALQSLKSNVGCCLNSRFNISDYDRNFRLFNRAGLWSACSVSPPGFCQSNLTLGSGTTSRNCNSLDVLEQTYAQIYCNSQIYQPILDIYQQCESPLYELFITQCGLSETNQFCALLPINNETYPRAVQFQCQNYTEGCTPSCYAALNSFTTAFGCCVNYFFYNNSINGNYRNTINTDLWSACGIPTPGFCTSTLSSQPTVPPTTRVSPMTLQTTSSSESSAVPNITMMLVLLVLLYMQV